MKNLVPYEKSFLSIPSIFSELEKNFFDRDWWRNEYFIKSEDGYSITLEIPGIKKEDIDISVKKDTLTIKGKTVRGNSSYEVYKTYTLPSDAKYDTIKAKQQDGLLVLSFDYKEEAKPKKIEITD